MRKQKDRCVLEAKVSLAGMRQSGSTLIYNVLVNLYDVVGFDFRCGYIDRLDSFFQDDKPVIVKSHEYDPRVHGDDWFVLTMRRDVRDTVASRIRRFEKIGTPVDRIGVRGALSIADEQIQIHAQLAERSDLEIAYEKYKAQPIKEVRKIADVIICGVDNRRIKRSINKAEHLHRKSNTPRNSKHGIDQAFDRTLLSKSHVTNGGKIGGYLGTLRQDEIDAICDKHEGWLRRYGYRV